MRKPSLTIGIPAYNEEGNIASLLASIQRQKQVSYRLDHIIVSCDGCRDKTVDIVRQSARTHKNIVLLIQAKRQGKAVALNKIYKRNTSDYLLTIDADLVFETDKDIDRLVRVMSKHPRVNLVGPRHIPIWPNTLWGKFAYFSYCSFEAAFLRWKGGNNFYSVMSSNLIRGTFSKTFTFPVGTISDQCYLYVKATRNNRSGYRFVNNARVLFRPVSTFKDWRLLGVRAVAGDKDDLAKYFGDNILKEIAIPRFLSITSQLKWLVKSPFYMIGSILMNIFIRKFPYQKMNLKRGYWDTTMSSKKAIAA